MGERRIIDAHRKFVAAQKRSATASTPGPDASDDTQRGGFIDMLIVTMTTPSGAFSRGQRELRLADALKSLSDDCQSALRLRYVDGLPLKEIATRLGKTDGATRVLLTRSLAQLQELLRHDSEVFSFVAQPRRHPRLLG